MVNVSNFKGSCDPSFPDQGSSKHVVELEGISVLQGVLSKKGSELVEILVMYMFFLSIGGIKHPRVRVRHRGYIIDGRGVRIFISV